MRSGFLHRAASALSRRVVGSYPKPWRDRYESEVLALLEDSPARLRDVFDLARGLAVERARATFEPGDRPVLLAILVFLSGLARAIAVAAPPIMAGWVVRYWFGPAPRAVAWSALLTSVVLMVTRVVHLHRTRSSTAIPSGPAESRLSARTGRVYLALAIAMTFLLSWTATHVLQNLQQLWWFYPIWDELAARRPWQVVMARALHDMRAARNELTWALLELERCERLVSEGMPAPLVEARETVMRLTQQREEALATLHGLGYRATLTRRSAT